MNRREQYIAELGPFLGHPEEPAQMASYLVAGSNLPGPRANLELAYAFAAGMKGEAARSAWFQVLAEWASGSAASDPAGAEEFLPVCALLALGVAYADCDPGAQTAIGHLLRTAAGDGRWRVREGAAMGLQLIGEASPTSLRSILNAWIGDATPMERRAIVAALAHPPILGDADIAELALDLSCRWIGEIPTLDAGTRRTEGFRVLTKGLEYGVSVFVAARPVEGFQLLRELAGIDDRDVKRILRSNLGKARLAGRYPIEVAEVLRLIPS